MGSELEGVGGYRVGDADRNRTADLLREAHVAGYLSFEELDERLGGALAAHTRGELDRLTADLPPEWRASHDPGRRPPPPRRRAEVPPEVVWLVVPLVAVVAGLLLLAVLTRPGFFFPWPLLWIFFFAARRGGRPGWRPPRW